MIIEIGTSDFDTHAGKEEGLYIEPVKYYFDRLPECNKINCAVSDYDGEAKVYYLTDEEIRKYGLPKWVRGCNSINKPHNSVVKLLDDMGVSIDILRTDIVPVKRIKTILNDFNVFSISLLKIDTEGHDCIILNDYFNTVSIKPNTIIFESNDLSDKIEVNRIIERIATLGYIMTLSKYNVYAKLMHR